MASKRENKPLRRFDYKLVEAPMDGLLFNTNRLLEKKLRWSAVNGDHETERQLTLLVVLLRFVKNSYEAVRYLMATSSPDPSRKQSYMLIVPPVIRQMLDLLFSLVYMREDFGSRSLWYQRAGWREQMEELNTISTEFCDDPRFRDYLADNKTRLRAAEALFSVTTEERRDLSKICYWPTPTQLVDRPGQSLSYRKYLNKWIYTDVSSQAHLGFGGVQKMSGFLLSDLMSTDPEHDEGLKRATQSYHFEQVSRAAIITLAVATEIDTQATLGTQGDADYLWVLFGDYVVEGKEMWERRYSDRPRYAT